MQLPCSELRACLEVVLGPDYHIEREVRPSASCRRFVACELPDGAEVLVKVLPADLARLVDPDRLAQGVERCGKLAAHPRIVPPMRAGAAGPFVYYVRPFVPGTTLRASLTKSGTLPLHHAVRTLCDVAEALTHAHQAGMPHGDLQPDTVLLGSDGHARLADVGLAGAFAQASRSPPAGAVALALADAGYVSPERWRSAGRPDPHDDLYAVGALGYAMLTGGPPTAAGAAGDTENPGSPAPVRRTRQSVSLELEQVVMGCLDPDPAHRWREPAVVLAALRRLARA